MGALVDSHKGGAFMFNIDQYLEAKRLGARHAGRAASPKTLESYSWALHKAESLLNLPLHSFTEHDAEVLLTVMDNQSLSTATRAQIMAACRGIFDWAIATDRYVGKHPFAGISTPTIKRTLPTILTPEQVTCFFNSFESEKYQLFFSLMYYAGMRIGEVRALQRKDVSPSGLIVRGKGGFQRIAHLPERIMDKLQRYLPKHPSSKYVFYGEAPNSREGESISLIAAYKAFHAAARACGLPKEVHPHNLRHSFATHLQRSVRDITITQAALGHKNPATTMLYAQIADEDVKAAHKAAFGK